ncbi:MAG: disulfide bond formation protein B [Reinekea sp.]|nr:disulfide bond formation protein B [Reinekea sp.]
MQKLTWFVLSRWYWLAVTFVGVSLEAVALFYQHVLGEPPCVLCIQARVWVLLGIVMGIVGLIGNRVKAVRLTAQVGLIVALIGLLNRSWISVLVERGLYDGQCGMDPGFPAWFSLDTWFPQVFEVWTMCGYTPNFLFGFTMGEGLVFAAISLLVIALGSLALMVMPQRR